MFHFCHDKLARNNQLEPQSLQRSVYTTSSNLKCSNLIGAAQILLAPSCFTRPFFRRSGAARLIEVKQVGQACEATRKFPHFKVCVFMALFFVDQGEGDSTKTRMDS